MDFLQYSQYVKAAAAEDLELSESEGRVCSCGQSIRHIINVRSVNDRLCLRKTLLPMTALI